MKGEYCPEGLRIDTPRNRERLASAETLAQAALEGWVLEARAVLCDSGHNLFVDLPCMEGIIPREEGAIGISEGTTRDIAIISRVSKPVSFIVRGFEDKQDGTQRAVLSRRAAQERCFWDYIGNLRCGDVIRARVTRLEPFGAFCDIGCGIPALLPIAGLSVSRISHPADRLRVGDDILCVVASLNDGRICLSMRELLGTWEENAAVFSQGQTVAGIVRSVEPYGIFVELAPNLAGLAEPREGVESGQHAAVYIKSILPEKLKFKLIVVDAQPAAAHPPPLQYYITKGPLTRWEYTPPGCEKMIVTEFDRNKRLSYSSRAAEIN